MKLIHSILIASRLVVLCGGLTLLAGGCGGEETTSPDQLKEQIQADQSRADAMQNASKAAKTKKAP